MSEKLDSGKMLICELCKKSFKQKCDYDKHKNAKRPCIPMTEIQKITQMKDVSNDNKSKLTSIFKNCLNILRDNEGLIGEKGLRTLSHLLILKLIEKHFGKEINIDEYEYDFRHIEDELVDNHRKILLKIVRFSKLIEEEEDDIPELMKYLWDDILSKHPATEKIFKKGKSFDIQHTSTYKRIFHQLNSPELSDTEYDVLGNSYEEVIQDIMTGKVLGQFFTQPLVKKMMVKLINPQIYPNGKIDTCGDPTMGTGGFLITYLHYILHQASVKNIKPDWDFIKTEGLYGKELEPDTYQLAVSNMLISTGHMFEQLDRGDSIREPITRKFNNILANPPFGIKGLKYDDFQSSLKLEYVPIKSDNAVSLFIQAIICMLNIGGKCAVVLPDGQDLFSKTNKTLVAVREYLMKTCDLKEIIYLPSGIFTYTSIKTCVFYFVKKREGSDVIEVKINVSKTQKETGRDYKFSKTHQTTKVAFYDYNPYEGEGVKNLFVEVPIEKIASNSYSLNYAEYMKDDAEEEQYEDSVVVKTLGEVCKFDIGGTPSRSKNEYYENGNNLWVSVRELNGGYIYDTKEKITDLGVQNSSVKLFAKDTILFSFKLSIGKTAIVGNPLYTNEAIAGILSKNNDLLNNKYLYYYLTINDFSKLGSGILGNGSLNKKSLEQIKIPIPSIERQQEIVKYLDFIYEKANKTSNEKITELKQLNEFCLNNQKMVGENMEKILGEVCSIDYGTRIVKGNNTEGEYPVYGSGRAMFSTNTFNREGYNILIGRFALSLECVRFINEKIFLNDSGLSIKPKTDILLHKYIGYYLLHNQSIIYNCARGTAQKNLEMDIFKSIKIPIPSLERQQEIIAYCEANDALIQQLEMEIENNKSQAQKFIDGIVKSKSILFEECETPSSSATESSQSEDDDEIVVAPKSSSIDTKSRRVIKSL
jgi:type I restriction-modification system DNA methylase subunit/restriction endonuclease S subunit